VIQEFFMKDIEKFVPEGHKCKCNLCGKDMVTTIEAIPANGEAKPEGQVDGEPKKNEGD